MITIIRFLGIMLLTSHRVEYYLRRSCDHVPVLSGPRGTGKCGINRLGLIDRLHLHRSRPFHTYTVRSGTLAPLSKSILIPEPCPFVCRS